MKKLPFILLLLFSVQAFSQYQHNIEKHNLSKLSVFGGASIGFFSATVDIGMVYRHNYTFEFQLKNTQLASAFGFSSGGISSNSVSANYRPFKKKRFSINGGLSIYTFSARGLTFDSADILNIEYHKTEGNGIGLVFGTSRDLFYWRYLSASSILSVSTSIYDTNPEISGLLYLQYGILARVTFGKLGKKNEAL